MSDNALGRGLDALIQKPETTKKQKKNVKSENENNNNYALSDEKIQEIKDEIENKQYGWSWDAAGFIYIRRSYS